MKKIPIIITVIVFSIIAIAQEVKYIRNPALDKFVGEWAFTNANSNFTIVLAKEKVAMPGRSGYIDHIEGFCSYINNSRLIQNPSKKSITMGTTAFNNPPDLNTITFTFEDQSSQRTIKGSFTLLPGNLNLDRLQLDIGEKKGIKNISPSRTSLSLPKELMLKKIK